MSKISKLENEIELLKLDIANAYKTIEALSKSDTSLSSIQANILETQWELGELNKSIKIAREKLLELCEIEADEERENTIVRDPEAEAFIKMHNIENKV